MPKQPIPCPSPLHRPLTLISNTIPIVLKLLSTHFLSASLLIFAVAVVDCGLLAISLSGSCCHWICRLSHNPLPFPYPLLTLPFVRLLRSADAAERSWLRLKRFVSCNCCHSCATHAAFIYGHNKLFSGKRLSSSSPASFQLILMPATGSRQQAWPTADYYCWYLQAAISFVAASLISLIEFRLRLQFA